jgi:hypothetical protein
LKVAPEADCIELIIVTTDNWPLTIDY